MSQEFNLNNLSITPQELDDRERHYEESEAWDEWVNFTRELAQKQADEQKRAMWRRLIKRFEMIAERSERGNLICSSDLTFICGQIWSRELSRDDLAMKSYLRSYQLDPDNIDALQEARKIYEAKEEWELALQLCTLEQDLFDNPTEEAALFLHMASICAY